MSTGSFHLQIYFDILIILKIFLKESKRIFVNEIYKVYEKSKRLQTCSNKFRANNIY